MAYRGKSKNKSKRRGNSQTVKGRKSKGRKKTQRFFRGGKVN